MRLISRHLRDLFNRLITTWFMQNHGSLKVFSDLAGSRLMLDPIDNGSLGIHVD